MFNACSSLIEAPELPATTLADNCYQYMFNRCYNLNSITVKFTAWSPTKATNYWLFNVAQEGNFYCPHILSEENGLSRIPNGWRKIDI